jgi:hypothetical protein
VAKATYFVDLTKAETLFQFDEQDAAAVLEPYAPPLVVRLLLLPLLCDQPSLSSGFPRPGNRPFW